MTVGVQVPATSANLGPGFDALAAAVSIHLTVEVTERAAERVTTQGEGAGEVPTDDSNLVWRAFLAWHRLAGDPAPDISLRVSNTIPLERGLGSSAAAAVAGAALGRALNGSGSDADLIAVASELEGHRDNAAAAVLGGLVVCYGGTVQRLEPSDRLRPVLCVPGERQSTAAARRLLPDTVPLAEAASNGARAAALLAGLSGALAWDPAAMRDALHEPARLAAMPDSGRLVAALRDQGVGAALSGAGPAVLALVVDGDDRAEQRVRDAAVPGWQVLVSRWDLAGAALTAASAPGG